MLPWYSFLNCDTFSFLLLLHLVLTILMLKLITQFYDAGTIFLAWWMTQKAQIHFLAAQMLLLRCLQWVGLKVFIFSFSFEMAAQGVSTSVAFPAMVDVRKGGGGGFCSG